MDWFLEHRTPAGLKQWQVLQVPATAPMLLLFGQQLPVVYLPANSVLPADSPLIKAPSAMAQPASSS